MAIGSAPGKERADFWVLDANDKYYSVPIDAKGIYHSTVLTFAEIINPEQIIDAMHQLMTDERTLGSANGKVEN